MRLRLQWHPQGCFVGLVEYSTKPSVDGSKLGMKMQQNLCEGVKNSVRGTINESLFSRLMDHAPDQKNEKVLDNIDLFYQSWNNISTIMNETKDVNGVMRRMPPLPELITEENLVNVLLSGLTQEPIRFDPSNDPRCT